MDNDNYLSSDEDIREVLESVRNSKGAGLILHSDENDTLLYDNEGNGLILGMTGCGKTLYGTAPLLSSFISKGESFVVLDSKPTLYDMTSSAAKQFGYSVFVLNFNDLTHSDTIDIFQYVYDLYHSGNQKDKENSINTLLTLVQSIVSTHSEKDPFWDKSAETLIEAVCSFLLEKATPEELNISSIYDLIMKLKRKSSNIMKNNIDEICDMKNNIDEICDLNPSQPFSLLFHTLRSAPSDTSGSILASTFEPLNVFVRSEGIRNLISTPGIDIGKLDGKQKVGIYVILPPNNNYANLASILISQLISHYFSLADSSPERRLEDRMNFVLEELGSVGHALPDLDIQMSQSRSRQIRFYIVLQSLSQLDSIYGKSKADTILGNVGVILAYRTNHIPTLEYLSKISGITTEENAESGLPIEKLANLKTGEALVIIFGKASFISNLPCIFDILNPKYCLPPEYPTTRIREKLEIFDLEKYFHEEHIRMIDELKEVSEKNSHDSSSSSINRLPSTENSNSFKIEEAEILQRKNDFKMMKAEKKRHLEKSKDHDKTSIDTSSTTKPSQDKPDLQEDAFFKRVIESRRRDPNIVNPFHLYQLTISNCGVSNRSMIVESANLLRIYPVSEEDCSHPFRVYFYSKQAAENFLRFVIRYGGEAILRVL